MTRGIRANSSMVTRLEAEVEWTQVFNSENRLASVSDGTDAWTFVYDGDGARVKQSIVTDQGEETTYFVGTFHEVSGEIVTKYYYASGQRIAMRADGNVAFRLGDHLGSTSLTTDGAGNVLAEIRYSAWVKNL